MGAAAAGGAIAGTQVLSAKLQADAMKAQGEWQEQQMRFNADVTSMQRREIDKKSQEDVFQRQEDVRQMLGIQKVAIAANGIDLDSDVSKQLEADTRRTGMKDVLAIKNNAWREAWGLDVKAQDLRSQGALARAGADVGAATTLATGGLRAIGTGAEYAYKK